jgi:hypothetical protein
MVLPVQDLGQFGWLGLIGRRMGKPDAAARDFAAKPVHFPRYLFHTPCETL